MEMTFRWYGKDDPVKIEYIRQIPGMKGIVTAIYDIPVGEVWPLDRILELKKTVEDAGLELSVIESVPVHEDIKLGLPTRDKYIENYKQTIRNLSKAGIKTICYNFMPVFDWTRSDLAKVRPDGSTVLSYDQEIIDKIDPQKMLESIDSNSNGFVLPGWEPERLVRIKELFEMYKNVDDEKLFKNLEYFLKAIMPTCEKYDIKMAIHPDDPAWPVFGLPRIIVNKENILRMVNSVNSPCNGVTLCAGSLGSNPKNDIPDAIKSLKDKIFFAHVRNLEHTAPGKFQEAAHLSSDGSMDMYAIMKAFYDIGYEGPMRPDHGRAIWGEVAMPGYGLYDRALGAMYLQGLWEAITKSK